MVKKLHPSSAGNGPIKDSVKDSAQQIWQAGLGAFTRAQAEGSKAFESLVKEGVAFQRKTQAVAEEKISEATHRMSSMATDISSKATGGWDKLENIFEERVAKALNKLGVPSAKDINDLIERIESLNQAVQQLSEKSAPARSSAKTASKAPAKPTAKRSTKAKSVASKSAN
ncbi:MAG: phasin family protein [Rhodoferax sp.]